MNRRPATHSEDGAVLILVLAFVTAVALVSTVLINQTESNMRFTLVERQNQKQVYAADAAVDYGIAQMQADNGLCGAGGSGVSSQALPFPVNGRTPTWSCAETPNASAGGVFGSDWAVFLTGVNGAPVVTFNGSSTHYINGSVYNAFDDTTGGPATWGVSNSAPLLIQNGTLQQHRASCPTPPDLTITGVGPSGKTKCTATAYALPAPREGLAASPPAVASPNPVASDATCASFAPGRYTSAPNLDPTKVNFFRGGVYYFDSIGKWALGGVKILGGTPQLGETRRGGMTCSDPTQGGVLFVFGGSSYVATTGATTIELFPGNAAGGAGVSVYQVTAPGNGWTASNPGANHPLISIDETGDNRIVMHGQIWAPNGSLQLTQGGGSSGFIEFRAGLVLADLSNVNSSSNSSNFFYVTGTRTVTVTGTGPPASGETGATVTVTAVVAVSNDPTTVPARIASWRLS